MSNPSPRFYQAKFVIDTGKTEVINYENKLCAVDFLEARTVSTRALADATLSTWARHSCQCVRANIHNHLT